MSTKRKFTVLGFRIGILPIVVLAFLVWQNWKVNAQGTQHGLQISWTAVTTDLNGNPISGVLYNVYRGTAAGQEGATPFVTGVAASPYKDVAGTPGVTYYYVITATKTGYSESAKSNEVNLQFPLVQTAAPTGAAVSSF